jgi:PAS domain S-box-containing protein
MTLPAREQELAAIYETVPGIVFYVAVEPNDDFRFLSMSRAGLVATGLAREQVVGRLVRDVIPPPSADLVLNHYREAVRLRRTVTWKEVSVYPAGRRVGEVTVTPLYDSRGEATHLVGIVHDITEREYLADVLRQQKEQLAFLLSLNDALRPLRETDDIQHVALTMLGRHLGVKHVTYATVDGTDCIPTASNAIRVPGLQDQDAVATLSDALRDACRSDDPLAIDDVRADGRMPEDRRAALQAHGVGAFVSVPLRQGDRLVALVGLGNATPRTWTPADIDLVRNVAERMAAAVEHTFVEYALRAAHQELSDSEARFCAVHDHAPFAISLTSVPDGTLVSVNEAFTRLFEFSHEEVIGRTRVELGISTPEWNRLLVAELERDRVIRNLEVCRLTKHGEERFLSLSIDPVKIGERDFLLTTAVDITEKKLAEAMLREREQRLRLALDASQAGSWTRDPDANHVDWDEGFRRLYGFSADEPTSFDKWLSRVHEDDRASVLAMVDEMKHPTTGAWDSVFRMVRPDGSIAWIQSVGRADRDATGRVTRLTGLELDITDRRRAEEALQARRTEEHGRELQLLLESAAQGIVSLDAQGRIVMANRALEAMFGFGRHELVNEPFARLVPASMRDLSAIHRSEDVATPRPTAIAAHADVVGRRKDGTAFPIEFSLTEVVTSDGRRAIAFVTDMTERRRSAIALQDRTLELERRTVQLRQLASDLTLAEQHAREQLAKTLHNGLQQLLVAASINLDQQLRSDVPRDPPADLLVQTKQLIDDAIAAARSLSFELSPPMLKTAGLPMALAWLANWNREKYGLEVRLSTNPLADTPRHDIRTLLFESVRELLFNVVKHAQVQQVSVDTALGPDNTLCITVTDDGIGFDPASLGTRTAAGHGGLGLFSIRERLTLLDGRLDIESARGHGTRFRLVAPRLHSQNASVAEDLPAHHGGGTLARPASASLALRILIVDDHAKMRDALRAVLDRVEFDVVGEAADGLEAIAQAQRLEPDVILMDVAMPRLDGIEATRRLCREFPFMQILGVSMQARTDDHPMLQAGAAELFTKGEDIPRLVDYLLSIHTSHRLTVGRAPSQ